MVFQVLKKKIYFKCKNDRIKNSDDEQKQQIMGNRIKSRIFLKIKLNDEIKIIDKLDNQKC